jgi:tetratricopeptide (TPR) repeat protein
MIRRRPPFWLSALNYYILAIAVAAALFFVLWGVLHDSGEQVPWVGAGLAACIVIAGAVFLREFILRISHGRQLAEQRRMEIALHGLGNRSHSSEKKLTIEKNAALLHEIKRKSDAAKILDRLPEGHREVFEMCGRYLSINSRELANVSPGSPRLAALLKGKDAAENFHKFHLIKWAEIESRHFSAEAKQQSRMTQKLESAQKALNAITSALHFYPNEEDLVRSEEAIREFIASIKLENLLDRADRASFKGNYRQARKLYRDALFFLERDGRQLQNSIEIANRISDEVEKIDRLNGDASPDRRLQK